MTVFSRRLIRVSRRPGRPAAEREPVGRRQARRKSASTGRPTIRCRCCSRTRASWRRNSPRTASRSRWVQTVSSSNALQFLNAGSIDFGSTAGSAALVAKINGNPDQVGLRLFAAGMDRAGHHQGQQDQQGRGPQGQEGRDGARHRPAHLRGARAARRRPDRQGHHPGAGAAARRRRHRAHPRRRRCLGRSRPDDGAARDRRTARSCSIAIPPPTPGASSMCARSSPRITPTSCSA